jgi:serine/threonine protein kinase/tetratricopeptide (TPR) repeat protein
MKCPKCENENPDTLKFCGECGTQLPSLDDIEVTETIEAPKEELSTGSTFAGRYQIIEELGKGGMGHVYKVLDKETKERIALKLIKPEIASDRKTIERFKNELTTARKIRHKNVCGMYYLGEEKGSPYITMEYVSGEDLKSSMRRFGNLPIGKAISITKQICEGLEEAHSLGVVHRDLKPNNIMIDQNGNARIMDFGIARTVKEKGITGSGVLIGTPEYMSPEQVDGKEVDERSDIYSLGVILYEMVTGQAPFEGDTPLSVAHKHMYEPPADPKKHSPQIPDDLSRLVLKCMEKDKANRYQSAGELQEGLENVGKGLRTTERTAAEKKSLTSKEITVKFNLKKIVKPGIVVVALIAAAILLWRFLPQKKAPGAPVIENSIAVISFTNQTGDPAFDYLQAVIPNLLITNLENTGLFHVATWERMKDILKQMGIKQTQVIDSELGFDLCRREGYKAIAIGTFSKAGDVFTTDVKIYDVETKQTLKSANTKGTGAGSILDSQINKLSREIAFGLGAGIEKIDAASLNIKDVTTNSLEAYKYFLKGREACNSHNWDVAKENLKKALESDPTFAMAHVLLAWAYSSNDEEKAANETIEKAMAFSDKTSKKDRLYLETLNAWFIKRDPDKPYTLLNELINKYPEEKWAFHILGDFLQIYRGDNLGAIAQYEKWLELDQQDANALVHLISICLRIGEMDKAEKYINMLETVPVQSAVNLLSHAYFYIIIGQLDKAIAKCKEALEIQPDFWGAYEALAGFQFLKDDYEEAMKCANEYVSRVSLPVQKSEAYMFRGHLHWVKGAFISAQGDLDLAEKMAEEAKSLNLRARVMERRGYVYLFLKEFELSQKAFEIALETRLEDVPAFGPNFRAYWAWQMGILAIEKGQLSLAKANLSKQKSFMSEVEVSPEAKVFFTLMRDLLEAEMLLAQGAFDQALAVAQGAFGPESQYWKESPVFPHPPGFLYYLDLIARIYAKRGDLDQAIQEYERLFKMTSSGRPFLVHPLYHYRIGLLYEEANETPKAIEHYEKYLDLWKDADPGIAEVEDARMRLAELN